VERHSYISTPHTSTSLDPAHWKDPKAFDPTRYLGVPTSAPINEAKCQQIGFARSPFEITNFEVKDGRKSNMTTDGDTIIQLNSSGPWGINYINPKDDPRPKM